ncbi:M23 family metallopeptidase [Colwellia sp. Bg11-12]|uniref:M23 family metallopeptidase n=1 Tax=Colwellia sp. Bg11-12 TaxID=2759817 RepID=UPI0015F3BC70|nr:M23 family metallopeptidase [Colwellia sp. Bg11-12]MBA6262816.1 M23 family metallopeptidase [Colwellia sp. Bg11-12]
MLSIIDRKKIQLVAFCLASILFSQNLMAEIKLSGEIKQGALVIGKTAINNIVTFDGKVLPLSTQGDYVFGFGRDDVKPHQLVITQPDGKREQKTLTPTKREYNIQRIEGIAKKIMNPNPKSVARSKKDGIDVRAARQTLSDKNYFSAGFIAPIKGVITGVYGSQRVFNSIPKRPHFGLDYAGNTGDPVKAPASGTVVMFVPDMFYSGGTMIIDHGHGITSSFLHLSKSYVKTGDDVEKGQVVAAVGSSGRTTGPHLDWRINWFNMRLDPALALKAFPIK